MQNPFVYGEVVPASAFVNRVDELHRLVGDLAAGQKVFLISPRRYGKSSLIRHALAAMSKRGALTVDAHRQQLQLVRRVPRRLRARAGVGGNQLGQGADLAAGHDSRSVRTEVRYAPDARPLGALTRLVPGRPLRARRVAPRAGRVRAACPPRRSAPPQGGRRARRVSGHRRFQRRARSNTRCGRRFSISATSGTCLPAPSQA